jgi:2,3-dihydroxy-p-cumate/2,3-dihydroxybenzoate 3,4-dioxygenase
MADIRYNRLGYVALNVSNLERSQKFYRDVLGLQPVESGDGGRAFFRCSGFHHDIVLHESPKPGLKRIGWAMEDAASLRAAKRHLASLDLPTVEVSTAECDALAIAEAFRSVEPNSGAVFEFFCGMTEADGPFVPTHTKIARLGHVVLNVADRPAAEKFLTEQLNFRVSDRIEGAVSFLRCFPNPFHHSLGVGGLGAKGLNHVNFMVTEVDDIGKAMYRCKKNDVPVVFGPGRHPPSESMFFYFLDPDGITLEYSFGMEEFPEVGAREPRLMPNKLESIDYWGAIPDPRFAKIGAIEPLQIGPTA